ncbi:MAG: ABC transporter permease [Fimbriiglobus sp.]
MTRWGLAGLMFLVLVLPLVGPFASLGSAGVGSAFWPADRWLGLLVNSLGLASLASVVAIALGVVTACLLERAGVFGERVYSSLILVAIFIPAPVLAIAWQIVLGTWLPPLRMSPGEVAWRPWNQGLLPAAWVHGIATWPWVVLIIRNSLQTVDRDVEDQARLDGVVWRCAVWPRLRVGITMSLLLVGLQTSTEIAITDSMMVRTFAEEVYTQFVGASDGLPGAMAIGLISTAISMVLTIVLLALFTSRAVGVNRVQENQHLGASLLAWGFWLALIALPVLALVWKAGGGASTSGWTPLGFLAEMQKTARTEGVILLRNVLEAMFQGAVVAGLAWWAVAWASQSKRVSRWLFVGCIVAAVLPGPVLGIGAIQAIRYLVTVEKDLLHSLGFALEFPPFATLFYSQPTPFPAMWVTSIRFFPWAVLILWPAVKSIPSEVRELPELDGSGAWGEWSRVLIPLSGQAWLFAACAVAALSLGEVSATKLVTPPSRDVFILRLFAQMHYGPETTVAALALWELAPVTALAGLIAMRQSLPVGRRE